MAPIASVIDTLYEVFIRFAVRCVAVYYPEERGVSVSRVIEVPVTVPEDEEAVPTFRTVSEILRQDAPPIAETAKNTIMYARSIAVPVYRNPTVEFDSSVGTIPYGEMVMVTEPRGRFFRVAWNAVEGWVRKEDLSDRAAHVYPEFAEGEEYPVDHPNTARVRALLGDPFGAGHTDLPLQAGEYVLYKLWRKGKRIDWPRTRDPRVPGLWHRILRGVPRIHMSIMPKVGAVMEYMMHDDIGHLAYVEAVFPDDAISISEANYPDGGRYSERVLTKEEWRELRPTFISVL